jgi:hypothetical protein
MMKKSLLILLFVLQSLCVIGQMKSLPIGDFYKDRLIGNRSTQRYSGAYFFPAHETEYPLHSVIRDSSKQYYDFTEILFKKHVIEKTGKNFSIGISPILNMALGKDLSDTSARRLFQNTRGIYIEGEILKNFSFTTSFQENQARFSGYQTSYYQSLGELYPNQSAGTYSSQNAVIPGASRTKPFKTDGFDYAFATGHFTYRVTKWLQVMAGNTQSFIGAGYRSLFFSDNSLPAPYYRISITPIKRLQFHYYRSRLLNLMRKPVSTTVEAYYEPKSLSINYLHYQLSKSVSLQLIESIVWSNGDSIQSKRAHPMYYNPIPILSHFVVDKKELNTVTGLQIEIATNNAPMVYAQVAIGNFNAQSLAAQIGCRWVNVLHIPNFMMQYEYNYVSANMYSASNPRLNYTHGNVPMAHSKGNGFHEGIARLSFEWRRFYAESKTVYYSLFDHQTNALLPVNATSDEKAGPLFHQQLELGYRLNRKMNTCFFGSFVFRREMTGEPTSSSIVFVGIRTGLFNQYTDF